MRRPSRLGLGLLLGGAGFGYGFVAAKRGLPPHDLLVGLSRTEVAPADPRQVRTPMANGWFERTTRTEGILDSLDDLGYGQTYELPELEVGVLVHDPERSWEGVNLVVSAHEPNALLLDMDGRTLHGWSLDYEGVPEPEGFRSHGVFSERFWRRARVLPDGGLLAIFDRKALVRLDRDSDLLWSLSGGYHHDLDVTSDGSIWTLDNEVHVLPRIHPTEEVFEDFLVRIDPAGNVVERISLLEAFERSPYAPLLEGCKESGDIFHTNTVSVHDEGDPTSAIWGPGRALVSIWGLDTVAIVDLERATVVWALTGMWHRQHEPVLLDDGDLLVFDNLGLGDRSRVVQLDPLTTEVTWSYGQAAGEEFSSTLIGSNQRLPNGNTLITESLAGNAFEVTPAGETVWRYQSPFRAGAQDEGVAVLMEVVRLPREDVADWLDLVR